MKMPQASPPAKAPLVAAETVQAATQPLENVPIPQPIPKSVKESDQTVSTTGTSQAASEVKTVPAAAVKVAETNTQQGQNALNENKPLPMSLAEAVALNLRRNVSIKLAYMDRVQQKYDFITGYYYAYQPVISTSLSREFSSTESKDNLTGAYPKTDLRTDIASLNADLKLPTGTSFSFVVPLWMDQKSSSPDYMGVGSNDSVNRSKTWGVIFSQPLLKGAGIDYNTADPKIAKLNEDKNKVNLKSSVNAQVKQIIQAYRTFLNAKWSVDINRASLKRSYDLLDINKYQVELGTMAPEDIVQTEADVATNEINLEAALNSYDSARINVLIILDLKKDTLLEPVESLDTPPFLLDEDRCMSLLLENQPTYLNTAVDLEITKLNAMKAKRDRLPDLSLSGSYNEAGLGGSSTDGRQTNKSIGLFLNIPLYGTAARTLQSNVLHTENDLKKGEINLRKLKDDSTLSIRDKVRNLRILQKKIGMAVRATALSVRKLENEKEKLIAGRSSIFQLTSYQDQLKTTQLSELQAKIDYLNALTELDDFLGTTTDTWNIDINDKKQGEGPLLKSTAIINPK